MIYLVSIDGKDYRLELDRVEGRWQCRLDGREVQIDAVLRQPDVVSLLIAGQAYEVRRERMARDTHLWVGTERYAAELRDPRSLGGRQSGRREQKGPRKLVALMPGKVVRVLVEEKAEVEAGQGVIVVEAMKMQNEIKSPKQGRVVKIVAQVGASVNAGDVLAVIE
jgi:biotin carboxyl carrier protein